MHNDRLINQFMEMVQVDSESGHERKIADYLLNIFKQLDVEVYEDNTAETTGHGAGNIYVKATGDPDVKPIYFTVHMDTVTPGVNIKPSIKSDYIVSDGTTILGSDDKAGIAALIEGLRRIEEEKIPHGDIEIVITVGEESGLVGAKAFDTSVLNSTFGYALDSTGKVGQVVSKAPTQKRIEAHIYGKTAHAGVEPEAGVSAITIASKAISKMQLGRIDEDTTANIGRIEGGGPTNVVTDYVYLIGEARSFTEQQLEDQIEHMKTAFEEAAGELGGEVEVKDELVYDALNVSPESEVANTIKIALNNVDRDINFISLGGGSDGNIFHGRGVETVVVGIGYEDIHTTSEKMPIEELEKASELVVEIAKVQYAK